MPIGKKTKLTVIVSAGLGLLLGSALSFLNSPYWYRVRGAETVVNEAGPGCKRILFVGNSLTFSGRVPAQFVDIAKAQNPQQPFVIKQIAFPNYTLKQHWELGVAQKTMEEEN